MSTVTTTVTSASAEGMVTTQTTTEATPQQQQLPVLQPTIANIRQSNLASMMKTLEEDYIVTKKLPGLSVHVAHKGKEIFKSSIGVRDLDSGKEWNEDTLHQVQSMTKAVTAAAFMLLVEEGKASLDDPVSKYVPGFGKSVVTSGTSAEDLQTVPATKVATIKHLMTHTAGTPYCFLETENALAAVTDKLGMAASAETLGIPASNMPDVASKLAECPLPSQPGEEFRYGVAMDWVAHIVTVITGQAFDTFLVERIFKPLGMSSTNGWYIPAGPLMENVSPGYVPDENGVLRGFPEALAGFSTSGAAVAQRENAGIAGQTGGGGIISSSNDYFKFALMLANKGVGPNGTRILQPETVKLMMTDHFEDGVVNSHVTFGDADNGCAIADAASIVVPGQVGFGCGGYVVKDQDAVQSTFGPVGVGTYGWLGYSFTEFWVDPSKELTVSFHSQVLWGQFLGMGYEQDGKYLSDFKRIVAEKVYGAMGL